MVVCYNGAVAAGLSGQLMLAAPGCRASRSRGYRSSKGTCPLSQSCGDVSSSLQFVSVFVLESTRAEWRWLAAALGTHNSTRSCRPPCVCRPNAPRPAGFGSVVGPFFQHVSAWVWTRQRLTWVLVLVCDGCHLPSMHLRRLPPAALGCLLADGSDP